MKVDSCMNSVTFLMVPRGVDLVVRNSLSCGLMNPTFRIRIPLTRLLKRCRTLEHENPMQYVADGKVATCVAFFTRLFRFLRR